MCAVSVFGALWALVMGGGAALVSDLRSGVCVCVCVCVSMWLSRSVCECVNVNECVCECVNVCCMCKCVMTSYLSTKQIYNKHSTNERPKIHKEDDVTDQISA